MDAMPAVVDYRARDALTDFLFDPVHLEWHLEKPQPDPSALHLLRNVLEKLHKNELRFRAAPLTQPATNNLKARLHDEYDTKSKSTGGGDLRQELYHIRNWLFCVVKIVAELDWNPAVICGNSIIPAHLLLFLLDLLACYFRRQDMLDFDQFAQRNNVYDVGDFVAHLLQVDTDIANEAGAPSVNLFIAQFCARCLLRLRISGACPPFFPKGTFVHVPGVTDAELALPRVGTTHMRQQNGGATTAPTVFSAIDTEDVKALNAVERLIAHSLFHFMQMVEKRVDAAENGSEPMLILTRAALKLIPNAGSGHKIGSLLTATASNITWSACIQVNSPYSAVGCLVAIDFIDSLLLDAEFDRARQLFGVTFAPQRVNSVPEFFMPHVREAIGKLGAVFSANSILLPHDNELNADLLLDCPSLCDCSSLPVEVNADPKSIPSLISLIDTRVAEIIPPTKVPTVPESASTSLTEKSESELLHELVDAIDVNIFQQISQRLSSASLAVVQEHYQKIINFIPIGLRTSLDKELAKLSKKQHAMLLLGKAFHCMLSPKVGVELLQKSIAFFASAQELCHVVLNESRRKVLQGFQTHAELQKFSLLVNSVSDPTIHHKQQTNRTVSAELVRWRDDERNVTKKILATVVERSLNNNNNYAVVSPELFFACVLTTYNMQNFSYLATIERTFSRDDFVQLISLLIKCEREFYAVLLESKNRTPTEKTALLAVPPPLERVNLTCLWLTVYQAVGGRTNPSENAEIRPLSTNINVNVISDLCSLVRNPCATYILTSCLAQLWSISANSRGGYGGRGGVIAQTFPNLWPNRVENADNIDFAALEQIFCISLERALSLHATIFNTTPVNLSQPMCFVRELLQIQRDYLLAQSGSVENTRACARICMDLTEFYGTPGFADVFPACAPFPVTVLRRLVLCCEELKYFTHVSLLAQYLFLCLPSTATDGEPPEKSGGELEVDEQIVREMRVLTMRALQERSTYDACDELYEFFFDIDMLEMLIHYLFQRNELEKKLKAMRVIGNPAINVNNEPEFLMWERMKLLRRYLRLLKEEFTS